MLGGSSRWVWRKIPLVTPLVFRNGSHICNSKMIYISNCLSRGIVGNKNLDSKSCRGWYGSSERHWSDSCTIKCDLGSLGKWKRNPLRWNAPIDCCWARAVTFLRTIWATIATKVILAKLMVAWYDIHKSSCWEGFIMTTLPAGGRRDDACNCIPAWSRRAYTNCFNARSHFEGRIEHAEVEGFMVVVMVVLGIVLAVLEVPAVWEADVEPDIVVTSTVSLGAKVISSYFFWITTTTMPLTILPGV